MIIKRLLVIISVISLTGLGIYRAIKSISFDVNILNSFNQSYSDKDATRAIRLYEEKLNKDFFLVLYDAGFETLKPVARDLYDELKHTKQFSRIDLF